MSNTAQLLSGTVLLGIAAAVGIGFFSWQYFNRRARRRRLMAQGLPEHAQRLLSRRFPLYEKINAETRSRLDGLINRFLDEIEFIGRDGFAITEEVRLIIAAQACLLLVNQPKRWYPTLKTVIVYPAAFKSKMKSSDGFVENETEFHNAGESWMRGPVVLAWDHAAFGALVDDDGHNVVLHEFAHQLDEATGVSDGSPLLNKTQSAAQWARAFQHAYENLQDDIAKEKQSVFDPYGAISPAEFFAVAVETFFEQPAALKMQEPAVYAELKHYFGIDPAGL